MKSSGWIDVGPQRHSFTVHFLKTEIKLENVSIGTSLVHQKQNYYYSPFQCSHCGTCLCHSLLFAVVKECTKQTAVEVIQDSDEEELIKLKAVGNYEHIVKTFNVSSKTPASISWEFIGMAQTKTFYYKWKC